MSDAPRIPGLTFFGLLQILFIGLKLTDVIDWSWWLVLAPIWMPPVAALGLAVIAICVAWVHVRFFDGGN